MLKYNFHFDDRIASWIFIKEFFARDKNENFRVAPKLTDIHIHPNSFQRMKVSLATQVMSHSVAAGLALYIKFGIFNDTAAGTAEFIERMNDVFDILNVSNFNSNKTYGREFKGTECQLDFLNKIFEMLRSLKAIDCNDKDLT